MSEFDEIAYSKASGALAQLAELSNQLGSAELETTAQNVTEAINEIKAIEAAAAGIDDTTVSSVLTWSSDKVKTENNKLPITNMVVNGNFANGLTGWSASGLETATVANNVCLLTANNGNPVLTGGNGGQTIPNGHKIYARCYHTPPEECVWHRLIFRDSTVGITDMIKGISSPRIGVRTLLSGIITLGKNSTYPRLQSIFTFSSAAASTGKVAKIEELLYIDLTETFGDGNEPTVEEMDELMTYFPNSWFDGTATVALMPYMLNRMREYAKSDVLVAEAYDKQIKTNKIAELTEKLDIVNRNMESMYLAKNGSTASSQSIAIKNVGKQKLVLHLHKRANDGYDTANDVYLPNAQNDFADVRIKDNNGEMLPYHVVYKGNIDIIPDKRLGMDVSSEVFTDSSKNMITDFNGNISISSDNGVTWQAIQALVMPLSNMVRVTSDDTIFFSSYGNKGKLLRSAPPYSNYTEVLDTNTGYTDATVLSSNMVEHPDGELFFGSYQLERVIRIYKSTDGGLTWTQVYNLADTYQHVHSLYVDTYANPVTIYAGVDGGGGIIKSTDKGVTWVDLRTDLGLNIPQSTDRGVIYIGSNGNKFFGGETAIVGGYSIIKTTDDVNYIPVLGTGNSVFNIKDLNGKLIAGAQSSDNFKNAAIYISEDDGETWVEAYTTQPLTGIGANDGFRYMSKDTYASTVYEQIIVGCQSAVASPLRIISGEDTYYAEIIVEVPETCTELTVESGYLCSNETLIVNDFEIANDKIISFGLNEGGRYIKESVSGKIFEGDFDYHTIGKHLSYNYPYITNEADNRSMKLSTLGDGINVDISLSGLDAFTISFWGRFGYNVHFGIISSTSTTDDYIKLYEYSLRNNDTTFCLLGYPITPDAFAKYDIVVDVANGTIKTYKNGRYKYANSINVASLLASITALTSIKLFRVMACDETDAIQHFEIVEGAVSEADIYNSYNDYISDNQH